MSAENTNSGGGPASPGSKLVTTVIDLLHLYIETGRLNDPSVYSDTCFSLARGIDHAMANNEVPAKSGDLPLLLRQVYSPKNDVHLQAAFMVLMTSVKNACKVGWFPNEETDDLLKLAKEVGKLYFDNEDTCIEPTALTYISNIISRFYPKLKMEHVLASFETNRELGTYGADFHISKDTLDPERETIRLFVARRDNMDTSSCIITPPDVNFLLNGHVVPGRVNTLMDKAPQLPTDVTPMLRYGPNLLQVVGIFNGPYIIAVAIMSTISSSDSPELHDYVQPSVDLEDSDSEIIKMTLRASLNCPISRRRIKTPVKGHLCKHAQCFDYYNFLEMNSRWPYWQCPCCKQPVCYQDIRIDQNMVKVLQEAGENVVHVTISADGSWNAVTETEDSSQTSGMTGSTELEVTDSESLNIILSEDSDNSADSLASSSAHKGNNYKTPPCNSQSNHQKTGRYLGALIPVDGSSDISQTHSSTEPNNGEGKFSQSHLNALSFSVTESTSLLAESTTVYSSSALNSNTTQSINKPRNTSPPSLHSEPVQLLARTDSKAEGTSHQASDNGRAQPPPHIMPPHLPGSSNSNPDQSP